MPRQVGPMGVVPKPSPSVSACITATSWPSTVTEPLMLEAKGSVPDTRAA